MKKKRRNTEREKPATPSKVTPPTICGNPNCLICKHNYEFQMPAEIISAYQTGRLALFCGAAISTEVPSVMPFTFYEEIATKLGHDPKTITTTFPDLMSEFCAQPNGRRELLQAIKARFDYIEAYPSLIETAARFHVELCVGI
jgi:hypothetical protein